MSTKQERPRLTRIFKVQLTDEQADAIEAMGASESLSAAAVIRRAVIRQFSLSPDTPNRSEDSQNGSVATQRQAGTAKAVKGDQRAIQRETGPETRSTEKVGAA